MTIIFSNNFAMHKFYIACINYICLNIELNFQMTDRILFMQKIYRHKMNNFSKIQKKNIYNTNEFYTQPRINIKIIYISL